MAALNAGESGAERLFDWARYGGGGDGDWAWEEKWTEGLGGSVEAREDMVGCGSANSSWTIGRVDVLGAGEGGAGLATVFLVELKWEQDWGEEDEDGEGGDCWGGESRSGTTILGFFAEFQTAKSALRRAMCKEAFFDALMCGAAPEQRAALRLAAVEKLLSAEPGAELLFNFAG